jgi:hypothetical protein
MKTHGATTIAGVAGMARWTGVTWRGGVAGGARATRGQRLRTLLPVLLILAALAVLGPAALLAAPRDLGTRIEVEVERLRQVIDAKPPADPDWKGARPGIIGGLEQVREALRARRPYLALERLRTAHGALRALELAKAAALAAGPGGPGMAGFDAAWGKARVELAAADRQAAARRWDGAPAALRALSEAAQGTTLTMLAASRAYATVTQPAAGYYYLGEAGAAAEFAALCYSLRDAAPPAADSAAPLTAVSRTAAPVSSSSSPPVSSPVSSRVSPTVSPPVSPRSVLPELRRLQRQTDAAYEPPRPQRLHGSFINLNATLKAAADLDAAGLNAGALYQYLNAVQDLATLDPATPPPGGAAARARLPGRIAALRRRLAAERQDASLAELFLERAEAALTPPPGTAPAPPALAQAAAIAERVVPAWFAVMAAAPAAAHQAAGATVTVTLVRWPFT